MAYCTSSDLEDSGINAATLIQLTDDERTATTASTLAAAIVLNSEIDTRITAAIAQADGLINSYIQKQYSPPVSATVPQIVKTLSVDLSIWFLHKRRRSELGVPEAIREIYMDAMKLLEKINRGDIDLGEQPLPSASDQVVAESDSEDPVFTVDNLDEF